MSFTSWMIVYTPDANRVANFNHINQSIRTNIFIAIDSVSNYTKYSEFSIEKNYNTPEYVKSIQNKPGKLGCNLSHQLLLQEIADKSTTDWNLVLEDDTAIYSELFLKDVDYILKGADSCKSKYIQLYTHPRFVDAQRKYNQIGDNLYNMQRQWGTCAYFIHKDAIPIITNIYPVDKNIDFVYSSLINELKSLCWLSPCVRTLGALDSHDKTSQFGSICNKTIQEMYNALFEHLPDKPIFAKYIPNKTQEEVESEKIVDGIMDDIIEITCGRSCVEEIHAENFDDT
jgi:GR25 family glycosyltransferase involved in LPS biosynthesis